MTNKRLIFITITLILELFHFILRKCAHFTEFMILGVFCSIALNCMKVGYKGVVGLGYCVLIASLDETLQLFVNGSAGRVQDVLIDSVGALVGILVVFMCLRFKGKNRMVINQQNDA